MEQSKQEVIKQFVSWLSEKTNKSPEEVIDVLNSSSEDDIANLMNQFKQDIGMFKSGGKMDYFVSKFGEGGGITESKPETTNKMPLITMTKDTV